MWHKEGYFIYPIALNQISKLAFDNWMQRDILFAQRMIKKAQEHNMNYMIVDGSKSIKDNYEYLVDKFNLRKI